MEQDPKSKEKSAGLARLAELEDDAKRLAIALEAEEDLVLAVVSYRRDPRLGDERRWASDVTVATTGRVTNGTGHSMEEALRAAIENLKVACAHRVQQLQKALAET